MQTPFRSPFERPRPVLAPRLPKGPLIIGAGPVTAATYEPAGPAVLTDASETFAGLQTGLRIASGGNQYHRAGMRNLYSFDPCIEYFLTFFVRFGTSGVARVVFYNNDGTNNHDITIDFAASGSSTVVKQEGNLTLKERSQVDLGGGIWALNASAVFGQAFPNERVEIGPGSDVAGEDLTVLFAQFGAGGFVQSPAGGE